MFLQITALKQKLEEEAYKDPAKALEHKEKGNQLFNDGKFMDAVAEYTESIKRNPL